MFAPALLIQQTLKMTTWAWFFTFYFYFYSSISFLGSRCDAEVIKGLPGQPPKISFKQHSGYIVTDPSHGRALFYYFAEADVANPLSKPLTLWLNGGPGCSSLAFGVLFEHGPFRLGSGGILYRNKYSWNLESNMLYVESPIGVGFSYSNSSSDYKNWNDAKTAEDNLKFIISWLEEFPQYKNSDLYLAGDSYAGHFVSQLADLVLKYNKQYHKKLIKLEGIAVGNPLLDLEISVDNGNFLWSHGVISDDTLMLEKTVCNNVRYFREMVHNNLSKECTDVSNRIAEEIGTDVDREGLLMTKCLPSLGKTQSFCNRKQLIAGTYGDPCLLDRIVAYVNQPNVQKALHANKTNLPYMWSLCEGPLVYDLEDIDMDVIPVVARLLTEGLAVMLYSGDQDTKIPITQTLIITKKLAKDLHLTPITKYGPWYDNKQVGGWTQSFGASKDGKNMTLLTFATVRGGHHEVPFTSPSQALTIFRALLTGSPLPNA